MPLCITLWLLHDQWWSQECHRKHCVKECPSRGFWGLTAARTSPMKGRQEAVQVKSVESCLGLYPVAQSPEVSVVLTSWPATLWVSTFASLFGQPVAASTVFHRKAWKWICNEPHMKTEASLSLRPTLCVVNFSLHKSFISPLYWIKNDLVWRVFCCGCSVDWAFFKYLTMPYFLM